MTKSGEIRKRSLWSSRFAFIMATAGAAVGLGNIWKFPYMAGNNGGGAFVVTYFICILFIGIPSMIAELLIGRRGRQNAVNTMSYLAKESGRSPQWEGVGWLGALILLMVLSFYSVVSGWSIFYVYHAAIGTFVHASPKEIITVWQSLLASPGSLIGWHTLFLCLTMAVVAKGVNEGIERASKWMMPGLFIILILLVIYAGMEGEFWQACLYLFSFKVEELTSKAIIDAMGQAFFSLATGAGCILVYGSYLSKETDMVKTVFVIAILDVLVALLSGLAIFPLVFSHGLAPESGPGLMFHALPIAFSNMPGSHIIGTLFFLLLLFAAWTSSISMGEPLVVLLNERWKISRAKGAVYIGAIAWAFGLISVFSFNLWEDIKLFGRFGIFEIMTDLPINILLPIGGILYCLFAGWMMKERYVSEEFHGSLPSAYPVWRASVRYLAPIGILIFFIANFF